MVNYLKYFHYELSTSGGFYDECSECDGLSWMKFVKTKNVSGHVIVSLARVL